MKPTKTLSHFLIKILIDLKPQSSEPPWPFCSFEFHPPVDTKVQDEEEGVVDGQVRLREDLNEVDHLRQLHRQGHEEARGHDRRGALPRQAPRQPDPEPLGLRRAGGFHGELFCVAERKHLPERGGEH